MDHARAPRARGDRRRYGRSEEVPSGSRRDEIAQRHRRRHLLRLHEGRRLRRLGPLRHVRGHGALELPGSPDGKGRLGMHAARSTVHDRTDQARREERRHGRARQPRPGRRRPGRPSRRLEPLDPPARRIVAADRPRRRASPSTAGFAVLSSAKRHAIYALRLTDGKIAMVGIAQPNDRPTIGPAGLAVPGRHRDRARSRPPRQRARADEAHGEVAARPARDARPHARQGRDAAGDASDQRLRDGRAAGRLRRQGSARRLRPAHVLERPVALRLGALAAGRRVVPARARARRDHNVAIAGSRAMWTTTYGGVTRVLAGSIIECVDWVVARPATNQHVTGTRRRRAAAHLLAGAPGRRGARALERRARPAQLERRSDRHVARPDAGALGRRGRVAALGSRGLVTISTPGSKVAQPRPRRARPRDLAARRHARRARRTGALSVFTRRHGPAAPLVEGRPGASSRRPPVRHRRPDRRPRRLRGERGDREGGARLPRRHQGRRADRVAGRRDPVQRRRPRLPALRADEPARGAAPAEPRTRGALRLTRRQFSGRARRGRARARPLARPLLERVPRCGRRPRRRVEQHLVPGRRVVRDQGVAGRRPAAPPSRSSPRASRFRRRRRRSARRARRSSGARPRRGAASVLGGRVSVSRSPGVCRTSAASSPRRRERAIPVDLRASAARGREVRVRRGRDAVPERSRTRRSSRRTTSPCSCAATARRDRRRSTAAVRRARRDASRSRASATASSAAGFGEPPEPAQDDGDRSRDPRRRADPAPARALPRLHLDGEARARPGRDRELRDARATQTCRAVLRGRHAHAPLAPVRGPQRLVPELRPARARDAMFRPGLESSRRADRRPGRRRRPDDRRRSAPTTRAIGASGTPARSSRPRAWTATSSAADGTRYRKGTAVPQRADFNTLDNPFAWSVDAGARRVAGRACRRRALRRLQPDAPTTSAACASRWTASSRTAVASRSTPRSIGQGLNSVFHATHRQNFLVPPRAHRSFPLSELRA